jgi:hypothetical protein
MVLWSILRVRFGLPSDLAQKPPNPPIFYILHFQQVDYRVNQVCLREILYEFWRACIVTGCDTSWRTDDTAEDHLICKPEDHLICKPDGVLQSPRQGVQETLFCGAIDGKNTTNREIGLKLKFPKPTIWITQRCSETAKSTHYIICA